MRRYLAPHFDLSERPQVPQWSSGSLRRIGLATCAVSLLLYGAYWGAVKNPAQMRWWALLLMSPLVFAYSLAFLVMWRDGRRSDAPARWRRRLA